MRDVNASLLPNENVQYQYAYPMWLKIVAVAAIAIFGFALYNDIRTAQSCMTTVDLVLVAYAVYWLALMLRDSAQYVVTDRRVMRLGATPQADQVIDYTQVSEVRGWKDFVSGNGYVEVKTADRQAMRIPMVGIGRSRTEGLAKMVDQFRKALQGEETEPAEEAAAAATEEPAEKK
jgi:hypothetical protein